MPLRASAPVQGNDRFDEDNAKIPKRPFAPEQRGAEETCHGCTVYVFLEGASSEGPLLQKVDDGQRGAQPNYD